MTTTRGPCSTTSGTRTSSTPSGTPTWHPTGSRTFGGTDDGRAGSIVLHGRSSKEDDAPYRRDHSPAGGRILRGMRSLGPTVVSASNISRFLGLRACAVAAAGSIVPSITLTDPPACASSEVLMYSIMASSSWSDRLLITSLCSTLCSRGISRVRHRKYTPGCSRRTFAMAFSPCLRKSRRSAQMTSSLSLLREPRTRPAGFPDSPGCQRLLDMCLCSHRVVVKQQYGSIEDSAICLEIDLGAWTEITRRRADTFAL